MKQNCYKHPIFKRFSVTDMGSALRLRDGILGAAAAFGLAATPMAANADDAQLTPVSTTNDLPASASSIEFLEDANYASTEWVVGHPDRVAVAIRYGGGTDFAPELIQEILMNDLEKNNVQGAAFFWERGGDASGTAVMIEVDGNAFGPFGLGNVRGQIPEIASQIKFGREIGLAQAMN